MKLHLEETVLVVVLLFGAVAFVVRSALQYVATGRTGFVGISGKVGSVAWSGGVLLMAGVALSIVAPLVALSKTHAPTEPNLHHMLGLATMLAASIVTFLAQTSMGASWRIGVNTNERTHIITNGPFAVCRNPIFSGMLMFSVGLLLTLPGALTLAALLCSWSGIELQVRFVEEPYLLATHGDAYRAYAARVGRFVPQLGRLKASP
jgi:protein-S-isoprenylcysteine O-methyltransferase Ste14